MIKVKNRLKILLAVLLLVALTAVILINRDRLFSRADTNSPMSIPFIANRANDFRAGTVANLMKIVNGNLTMITPGSDAPSANPYTGSVKFTIDSYQTTTDWISLDESGFTFNNVALDNGVSAVAYIKASNTLIGGDASGVYLPASLVSMNRAYFYKTGNVPPKGRYATVLFKVSARPGKKTFEFPRIIVNANSFRINCPTSATMPIPVVVTRANITTCFGQPGSIGNPGSSLVDANLINIKFKGKEMRIHKAMIPNLLQAENLILDYEVQTNHNYEVKTLSGYFIKNIKNTNVPSAHSWGLAFDLNSATNVAKSRASLCPTCAASVASCCPHDMPDYFSGFLKSSGLGWGAEFSLKCDAMHFQYGGSNW
jgi:hypothetical protein